MTHLAVPSKEAQLRVVGPRDHFTASRIQRLNLGTDYPTTDIDELGNPLHVGTVKDIPNITLTFSAFDVSIKIFSALTGTDATSYPSEGVDISSLSEIDAIVYIKDPDVSDYLKSIHARKLQIRDFSFSYSVDGESTEDYTAVGSKRRYFKNDIVVDKFTSGTTSFNLSETPIQLKSGDELLSVVLDGNYLTEVAAAPSTGEYSVSGTTLTTGDSRTSQVLAVYHANPAGTAWGDVSDSTIPAAIRGRDVDIEIGANGINRVQSVTINGNLNSEPVREMGNRSIVGYQTQVPSVEGTVTILDTDIELVALLTTGDPDSADTEFDVGDGCTVSGISIEIKIYDPCEDELSSLLKTVYIPSVEVVGDSWTSNVNNNATYSFNYRSTDAQCLIYSGSR
jgi:hypothetical protein